MYKRQESWAAGRCESDDRRPEGWSRQKQHLNRPVVGVSWYEAMAFCRWASAHRETPEGAVIRLPSSDEWEAAARGTESLVFPWGAEALRKGEPAQANWSGADPSHASPVGAFPFDSRGGITDLAGNVLEWCCDEGGPKRGLRGGSWGDGALRCRSAYRRLYHPSLRYGFVGFRVVLAPQVSPDPAS